MLSEKNIDRVQSFMQIFERFQENTFRIHL